MTMAQNNRNDGFNFNGGNERGSFNEHNESMRMFRKSHTNAQEHNESMREFRKNHAPESLVKVSRRDLINTMWPLLVTDTVKETGGSKGPAGMMDWSVFVPMGEGTTRRFSSN